MALTQIACQTVSVVDNGMCYEVDFLTHRNSEDNIARGGNPIIHTVAAFRLKADGSRGLRLKGINQRICEIAAAGRLKI